MAFVLDIIIIILITVMIGYSIVLNTKLKAFRNTQTEMAALIEKLNAAIGQAQTSIEKMKNTALSEETRLEGLFTKARMLADELEIITQSGSNLANRIEQGLFPEKNGGDGGDGGDDFREEESETESEENSEMRETLKNIR